MELHRILISNFKNLKETSLEFSHRINCITGNNGMGKTNLLDAVYYLSMCKSFFHFPDSLSIVHGQNNAWLSGTYIMDDNSETKIGIALYGKSIADNKVVKCNDKTYKRLSDHIGLLPIVMVSPQDTALVNLGGEERRRFVNQLISQIDREYLVKLQNYNRLLAQRNRLLKNEELQEDLLQTINSQMSDNADYIFGAREELCRMLKTSVEHYYKKLSGGGERVRIVYDTDLHKGRLDALLEKSLERDRFLKYTSAGIHKDDFLFEIAVPEPAASAESDLPERESFYPVKRCASQGQQKCFLICLKLAQFEIMKQRKGGVAPILLLDDIFDKLDMSRVENLLALVSENGFGQIFITDSNKVRMNTLIEKVGGECKYFNVTDGVITQPDR